MNEKIFSSKWLLKWYITEDCQGIYKGGAVKETGKESRC